MVPLLLIPLLMRWLPESQAFQRAEASVPLRTLFAPGQAAATLLLWLGYFFTLLVVYMLINWLPMLLVGQGIPRQPGGGGDVLSADRRRLRHAAAGGANG